MSPVIESKVEVKTPVVSVNQTTNRLLMLPIPLVLLLIVVTVLACRFLLIPHNPPGDIGATFVPTGAQINNKAVDPAELQCMAENIYFEAGGESLIGKIAVGQVVLNRLKRPDYPKTVCGVVHQKTGNTCMFSWLCEGAKEIKNSVNWQQSQQVAYKLLSRDVDDLTEGSTNFHGTSVNPKWNLRPTVKIDGHQFYR